MRNPFSSTGAGSWVPEPQRHLERLNQDRQQVEQMRDMLQKNVNELQDYLDMAIPVISNGLNDLNRMNQQVVNARDLLNKQLDCATGYYWDAPKGDCLQSSRGGN